MNHGQRCPGQLQPTAAAPCHPLLPPLQPQWSCPLQAPCNGRGRVPGPGRARSRGAPPRSRTTRGSARWTCAVRSGPRRECCPRSTPRRRCRTGTGSAPMTPWKGVRERDWGPCPRAWRHGHDCRTQATALDPPPSKASPFDPSTPPPPPLRGTRVWIAKRDYHGRGKGLQWWMLRMHTRLHNKVRGTGRRR